MPTPLECSIGAHDSWANTKDRSARTAPARLAFHDSFEAKVDPHNEMTPEDRAKAAENARKAFYMRMAAKSAAVRSARRQAREGAA